MDIRLRKLNREYRHYLLELLHDCTRSGERVDWDTVPFSQMFDMRVDQDVDRSTLQREYERRLRVVLQDVNKRRLN